MLDPRRMAEFGYGNTPRYPDRDLSSSAWSTRPAQPAARSSVPRMANTLITSSSFYASARATSAFIRHCSRFCCMYSIKHAYQAIDHGVRQIDVLYMDVRAYGKGFDGFWQRTAEQGARFVRGRPSRIATGDGGINRVVL